MDALGGVRVVDNSTGLAGPLAAMLLADFGAEVVKVSDAPPKALSQAPGQPLWDRGKTIVPSDSSLDELILGADILVTSDADDALAQRARERNPAIVVLRTPPWLGEAPWAGGAASDAFVAAMFGLPLRQFSFDGGPVDVISPVITTIQGVWAAACGVAALLEREGSGCGQIVTVSGEHGAMVAAAGALTFTREALAIAEAQPRRRPSSPAKSPGGSIPFYRTYRCADDEWLFFAALTPRFTQLGFEALGITDLFDDPRLERRGRAAMIAPEHIPWVSEEIARVFLTADRDEWLQRLREAGCPAGPVLDRDAWFDHPQIDAIGMAVAIEDPVFGEAVVPGLALKFARTPGRVRPRIHGSSPRWDPKTSPAAAGSPDAGPLAGVRVLDLGAIIAGPFSTSLLADLGSDVIKVEPPTGDSFRGPGFAAYNKGQRGIALDLRHPDGKNTFLDLVRTADVVVDNYRPGVLQRLGITWEDLQDVAPHVICLSITGFGDGGPHGGDAGFDPVLQAMSGMMKAQGGDSDPVFYTVPVNDVAGSATLAFGAVVALFHRQRCGVAQQASTSLAAMSVLLQADALIRWAGRPEAPRGSRDHPGPSPLDRFYAATDGWIRIRTNGAQLSAAGIDDIGEWTAARSREHALDQLHTVGIAAVPVRKTIELADDPHLLEHGILHRDPRPDRDGFTAGRHAHFDRTMRGDTLVSPRLGEHTREVLAEIGYTADAIERLVESGATKVF